MSFKSINKKGRPITLHKSCISPEFNSETVLVKNVWEYVDMWLSRNSKSQEARFYWNQANDFYNATIKLNKSAAPLTAYYCFLNAVKALLKVKQISHSDKHGVTGTSNGNYTSLRNEEVTIKTGGILASLCKYYKEPVISDETYNLKDLFYNLPFIHRAYCLSYANVSPLFIPIDYPVFVRKDGSSEAWFCCELSDIKYKTGHVLRQLPTTYEKDEGITDKWIIRRNALCY